MLFSEKKQCHTEFLSNSCLPFLTCLANRLPFTVTVKDISRLRLARLLVLLALGWWFRKNCTPVAQGIILVLLDLTGLNIAQTIKYSAEPSSFYFSGDSQLHDVIQICSQHDNITQSRWLADVLKMFRAVILGFGGVFWGFCLVGLVFLFFSLVLQITNRKWLWRKQQLPIMFFPFPKYVNAWFIQFLFSRLLFLKAL